MDTALVPGTLYYVAGYKQGSDKSVASGDSSASSADAKMPSSDSTGKNVSDLVNQKRTESGGHAKSKSD